MMRDYKNLFIWENSKCLSSLNDYWHKVDLYFEELSSNKDEALNTRQSIMKDADHVEMIFIQSGKSPFLSYGSNALGYRNYSIVSDIPFFITEFIRNRQVGLDNGDVLRTIKDRYDITIGIYEKNRLRSILNTFNPLAYINRISDIFLRSFFHIFDISLDDQHKPLWRFVKSFIDLISYLTIIWGFLKVISKYFI